MLRKLSSRCILIITKRILEWHVMCNIVIILLGCWVKHTNTATTCVLQICWKWPCWQHYSDRMADGRKNGPKASSDQVSWHYQWKGEHEHWVYISGQCCICTVLCIVFPFLPFCYIFSVVLGNISQNTFLVWPVKMCSRQIY